MKTLGSALAATGVAVVLAVGFPLNAQAATGTFLYHTQPGNIPHVLDNPGDERCYSLGDADGETENSTDRDARLYYGRGCTGDIVQTLSPGESDDAVEFASVRFVS